MEKNAHRSDYAGTRLGDLIAALELGYHTLRKCVDGWAVHDSRQGTWYRNLEVRGYSRTGREG